MEEFKFCPEDLKEIEDIKSRETNDILNSLNDCMEMLEQPYNDNEFRQALAEMGIGNFEERLKVTIKIMTAVLKDRHEGIH